MHAYILGTICKLAFFFIQTRDNMQACIALYPNNMRACIVFFSYYGQYASLHASLSVYLSDFFCSRIQFYLLLSPYLCFISLLYLDLYVLGDDALIS